MSAIANLHFIRCKTNGTERDVWKPFKDDTHNPMVSFSDLSQMLEFKPLYFNTDNEMVCTYGFHFCDNIIKSDVVYLH